MRRAINVFDLASLRDEYSILVDCMIAPVLTRETVHVNKQRVDEIGILVRDDVPAEQWNAIKEILRNGLGVFPGKPKHALRIYEGSKRV